MSESCAVTLDYPVPCKRHKRLVNRCAPAPEREKTVANRQKRSERVWVVYICFWLRIERLRALERHSSGTRVFDENDVVLVWFFNWFLPVFCTCAIMVWGRYSKRVVQLPDVPESKLCNMLYSYAARIGVRYLKFFEGGHKLNFKRPPIVKYYTNSHKLLLFLAFL